MRRVVALVAVALLTGCAGEAEPQVAGPPRDAGHGSVEEVVAILDEQGVPCPDAEPVALPEGTEQAVTCTLKPVGERVLIVHFLNPEGARAFEEQTRGAKKNGVYAETWGARTETPAAAELLAKALKNRGSS